MYTYIAKSQELYKIGKAKDVRQRISTFKIGNPHIEHIKTIEGNYESHLHEMFKNKRVTGEWFSLTIEDIGTIDEIIRIRKEEDSKRKVVLPKQVEIRERIVTRPVVRLRYDEVAGEWKHEMIKYDDDREVLYVNIKEGE